MAATWKMEEKAMTIGTDFLAAWSDLKQEGESCGSG